MTIEFTTPPPDSARSPGQAGSGRGKTEPPTGKRTSAVTLARQRRRVMARMWAAAEGQLEEIESRLARLQDGKADVEREARTLALLARVVRELSRETAQADAASGRPRTPAGRATRRFPSIHRNDPAGSEDERTARNLDQLRDDLARHLQRLRDAAGTPGPSAGAERA